MCFIYGDETVLTAVENHPVGQRRRDKTDNRVSPGTRY